MRIFVDARILTKSRSTGVEEYARSLVGALLLRDTQNEYVFFYNGLRKDPFPAEWRKPNVRVLDTHFSNKALEFSFRFLKFPKMERFSECDLYFSPHLNLIHTRNDRRRVIVFHDLSFEYYPGFFPFRKRFWHWEQDPRGEALRAGRVVAVSDFTRSTILESFRVPAERVITIHSGINPFYMKLSENDPTLLEFRKKHLLEGDFLLSVGTFEPRKNIPAVVSTFNHLKEEASHSSLKLVLAGSRGWMASSIEKEIKSSPWERDIMVLRDASRETLRFLYNSARVFLYPSFFEGFGFPPLEAQACGTPVVASNRASLPEILGSSACLVDPWRVEEIADATRSLLTDADMRTDYCIRGEANIRRFSWDRTAEQFLKLFESLYDEIGSP